MSNTQRASRDRLRTAILQAEDAITAWIDLRRRVVRTPGVQVAIRVGEELVYSRAFGSADLERGTDLTTRHLFRVASHSKTFVATLIMKLREKGLVGLDDRVSRWVPELADTSLANVTVRELLAHQGGIIRDGVDSDYWQILAPFPDAGRLMEGLTKDGSVLVPNAHFKYTNYGYALLGLVVERATGRTFADVVQDEILTPLGLDRVHVDIDDVDLEECAWGHSGRLDGDDEPFVLQNVSTGALAPATGFVACAEDLTAYASAHVLGDTRLLDDASKRLMQRPESIIEQDGEETSRYGLGLIHSKVGKRRLVGHSGGFPGFITRTYVDPTDGLVVSALTNQTSGPATEYADGIVRLVDLALGSADDATPTGLAAEVETLTVAQAREKGIDVGRFTGRFYSTWGTCDVRILGERLFALAAGAASPTADAEELRILDADTLLGPVRADYGASGEPWHYTWAQDGSVASVRSGGSTMWTGEAAFRDTHRRVGARRN